MGQGFLLQRLSAGFTLLALDVDAPETLDIDGITVARLALSRRDDGTGMLAKRYLGAARTAVYLIRPDQHVAARWPAYDARQIAKALRRATGRSEP